jgi:hypothetical protein
MAFLCVSQQATGGIFLINFTVLVAMHGLRTVLREVVETKLSPPFRVTPGRWSQPWQSQSTSPTAGTLGPVVPAAAARLSHRLASLVVDAISNFRSCLAYPVAGSNERSRAPNLAAS